MRLFAFVAIIFLFSAAMFGALWLPSLVARGVCVLLAGILGIASGHLGRLLAQEPRKSRP